MLLRSSEFTLNSNSRLKRQSEEEHNENGENNTETDKQKDSKRSSDKKATKREFDIQAPPRVAYAIV